MWRAALRDASEKKSIWELAVESWLENVAACCLSALRLTTGPKFSLSSRNVPRRTPSARAIFISEDNEGMIWLFRIC